jgi:hypothetical protein
VVPVDSRFTAIPPQARLDLVRRLRACLGKLSYARGKALLEAFKGTWKDEPLLVEECERGIAEIG